jgi:hypothetical protein
LDSLRKAPPIDSDRRRRLAIAPTAIANARTQPKGIWKSGVWRLPLLSLSALHRPSPTHPCACRNETRILHPFVVDRGLTVERQRWTNLHNALRFRLMLGVPCTGKGYEIAVPARIDVPTWMILSKWPDIYFQ